MSNLLQLVRKGSGRWRAHTIGMPRESFLVCYLSDNSMSVYVSLFPSRDLTTLPLFTLTFWYVLFLLVYDVTQRETFANLSDVWAKEVELYSTNQDCIKMLVGNKVDMVSIQMSHLICCLAYQKIFWCYCYNSLFHCIFKLQLIQSSSLPQDSERAVSTEEGLSLAKTLGSLFLECSAKTRANVKQCFEELALKVVLFHILKLGCGDSHMDYLLGSTY